MKIKPYRKCDICGKPYDKSENALKVKVGRRYEGDMWSTYISFDTFDVCPSCADVMIAYIRGERGREDRTY